MAQSRRIFEGTAAATGSWNKTGGSIFTVQATTSSAAITAATIIIEVNIDNLGAITAGTITLSDTVPSDGIRFDVGSVWENVRARVTSMTGTGTIYVTAKVQE